jgi:hypothetical protein
VKDGRRVIEMEMERWRDEKNNKTFTKGETHIYVYIKS